MKKLVLVLSLVSLITLSGMSNNDTTSTTKQEIVITKTESKGFMEWEYSGLVIGLGIVIGFPLLLVVADAAQIAFKSSTEN